MFVQKLFAASLLAVSLLLFTSCSDDDKEEVELNPITLLKPENGAKFKRGEFINVEFEVNSSTGISSYKLDIHHAGGHNHRAVEEATWTYEEVHEDSHVGEKKAVVKFTTAEAIPANAKLGEYHLGIHLIEMDKKDTAAYIEIEITE